jgi:hypothetical protein
MKLKINELLLTLPYVSTVLLWNIPFFLRGVIVEQNVLLELVISETAIFGGLLLTAVLREKLGRLYLMTFYLSIGLMVVLIAEGLWRFAPFYVVSAAISIRFFLLKKGRSDLATATIAFSILMLLLILSTSLRFITFLEPNQTAQGYVFSIYSDSTPLGIPFTYAYGIVIGLKGATLTLSPLTAVFFPVIAYLTADNTVLIIRGYRSGSAFSVSSAVVVALACQCENTIGILSGTVSSLALSIIPYFIFLSAGLLLLTNLYLHNPVKLKLPKFRSWLIVLLFIATLGAEFAVVSTGRVYNLALFGFISFLSIISGFLLGFAIPIRKSLPTYSIIGAFAIQMVMFWPFLIREALIFPSVFEIYNFSGLAAGLILSLSFKNRRTVTKVGLIELIFSMETMVTAAFLYLTIFSVSIFSGFSELEVVDFSVFILAASLPIMWFSNIYLLSLRAFST